MKQSTHQIWFISAILAICLEISSTSYAAVITGHLAFHEHDINPTACKTQEGETVYDVLWKGLDHEDVQNRLSLPIQYLTIQVPTYTRDFKIAIDSVIWGNPIELDFPLGHIDNLKSSFEVEAGSCDYNSNGRSISSKKTKSLYSQPVSIQIVNEYFLRGYEHYVVAKVYPMEVLNQTNVRPCTDIRYTLTFNNCQASELDFALPDNTDSFASNGKISKAIGSSITTGDYIIITTKKLKDACKELSTWKAQKGLNVSTVTIEEILSNNLYRVGTNGIVDEADAVRRFLQSRYIPNRDIYCIFIGPTDELPIRYLYDSKDRNGTNGNITCDNFVPTDIYYSDLIKNWDLQLDSTGIYSQALSNVTYSPSIFVGRLICSTEKEISNYTHKLFLYEAFPGRGKDDYLANGLVTKQMQHLNYTNLLTELGTYTNVSIKYDNKGGSFSANTPTGPQIINEMGQAGLISMQGHGNPETIAVAGENNKYGTWRYIKALDCYGEEELGTVFTMEETGSGLDKLNNMWTPSVLYSLSCDVMPFDMMYNITIPYNIGSAFTVSGRYGGVAMLGNTRIGWDAFNVNLEKEFASKVKELRHIGKAHALAKPKANLNGYACASHNLMGDPELTLWLNKPNHKRIEVSRTSNTLTVTTDQKGATVSLYDGKGGLSVTNTTGTVSKISLDDKPIDKTLFLTSIWQDGNVPYITLSGSNTTLSDQERSFVTRQAIFGSEESNSSNNSFIIDENGILNVKAVDSISIHKQFNVKKKGSTKLECMGKTVMEGAEIEMNGEMTVNSHTVIIESDFKVNKGAKLKIAPY